MNQIKFKNKKTNKDYYLIIFLTENDYHLNSNTSLSFSKSYSTCFNSINNIEKFLKFANNNGCSFIITDLYKNVIFFASFIKNEKQQVIELYNVCKNFDLCDLNPYDILNTFMDNYLIDNPLFNNYNYIRLAILIKSKYLKKALSLYTKLGFKVESTPSPLYINLPSYMSMICNLKNRNESNLQIEYDNFVRFYTESYLEN